MELGPVGGQGHGPGRASAPPPGGRRSLQRAHRRAAALAARHNRTPRRAQSQAAPRRGAAPCARSGAPGPETPRIGIDRTDPSKAEHAVDLETGAIVAVTVQDAAAGDSATLPETLTTAAEQVEAVQPDGAGVEEVVADKGYHSDKTLVALDEIGVRSYVSEPERGQRCWQDKKTGETPPEKLLRSGRCTGTAVVFAERGAVVYNGGVASWWSGLSHTSMKPGVCVGCGCAAMRMSASECSSRRLAATSGCCCTA